VLRFGSDVVEKARGGGDEMDRVPVGNQSVEELAGKRDLDVTETPVSIHPAPGKYPRIRKETKNPKKSLNRTSRAT